MIINVQSEGGRLTGSAGNVKDTLYPASTTDFYSTSSFLKIHFIKDEKGKVSGFRLDRYGSSEFARKEN